MFNPSRKVIPVGYYHYGILKDVGLNKLLLDAGINNTKILTFKDYFLRKALSKRKTEPKYICKP